MIKLYLNGSYLESLFTDVPTQPHSQDQERVTVIPNSKTKGKKTNKQKQNWTAAEILGPSVSMFSQ